MKMRGFRSSTPLAGLLLALAAVSGATAQPLDGSLPIIQRQRDPQTEYLAGMAALNNQKYRDAKSHFEQVLAVQHGHPYALYGVGKAEAGLGDLRGAARDYQAALEAEPTLIDALHQLALTDVRLGRDDQARAQLARLKQFAVTCASACAQAADIDAAIGEVETSLSAPATAAKTPAS